MVTNKMGINGESNMITPERYYRDDDYPDNESKKRMWNSIQKEVKEQKPSFLHISDSRSFIYGIAAAIMLYFTSIGVYTKIRESIYDAKPEAIKLDEAYQSAIGEFEKVIPQLVKSNAITEKDKSYLELRKEQLGKIDAAIVSLRSEIRTGELTPLKQQRLRQLYSMKLKVLQQLIDNGEIEL